MITGQDLVEWQLVVAAGEPLPLTQEQLRIDGHAVEVRLYAEDPNRNFLPSTGTLVHLRLPEEGPHVRRRYRRAPGRYRHAVLRSDDRQGDRARPRPDLGDAPHGGVDGRDRGGRRRPPTPRS